MTTQHAHIAEETALLAMPSMEVDQEMKPASRMKLEKMSRSCRKSRWGATAVEFAVVAPVFFLFIFGMIEFGRVVMVQQFLTNATREGARVGILDNSTTSEVNAAVNTYLNSANITGATITVNPNPPSNATYGSPVTVTVSVPFSQVSWLPSPMFLSGKTLTASSIMRRETVQ